MPDLNIPDTNEMRQIFRQELQRALGADAYKADAPDGTIEIRHAVGGQWETPEPGWALCLAMVAVADDHFATMPPDEISKLRLAGGMLAQMCADELSRRELNANQSNPGT